MRRGTPLHARIAVTGAVAVALTTTLMAVAAYLLVAHELRRNTDLGLQREVTRLSRLSPTAWIPAGPCEYLTAPACAQKVSADGHVTDDAGLPVTDETRAVAAGQRRAYFSQATVAGHPVRMLTSPLADGLAVQVAVRTARTEESLDRVGLALITAGLLGVAVAAAAGYFVARTGMRPVRTLTEAAEAVAASRDPGRTIEVRGTDELARLSTGFNTMLAELDEALAAQRQLVADASHELRTPLTGLRTNLDLLRTPGRLTPAQREAVLDTLHTQATQLTTLVTDLIDLARGEEPVEETDDLRLDLLVEHCAGELGRHWPSVAFRLDLDPVTVNGEPARLSRAVRNLLDNAAKFSPPGGVVTVTTRGRELAVRDTGPGIPEEDLERVFERFYRSPSARSLPGSGLGLAIVGQVARGHGAEVRAERPSGGGTVVRLRFP
ncbi:two-component system sensor histidine kinase MprB [Crossiella equi]|uniref:histidine kinase n=1 Tax=Crossiella equi TaxID=130796 RepID=A0ABS5A841_9PSEU|nr:HAMP domain-containing sensor histidine kinase [Crossiella equi]MBP2472476.1 two-component system sensor histidine kinase MprB [Crossiella equi]